MNALLLTRSSAVWLLLVVATLASWAMGHGMGLATSAQTGAAIIVIALIKFRCILFEFMELRDAPPAMRLVGNLWCLLLAGVLVGLFLAGSP